MTPSARRSAASPTASPDRMPLVLVQCMCWTIVVWEATLSRGDKYAYHLLELRPQGEDGRSLVEVVRLFVNALGGREHVSG